MNRTSIEWTQVGVSRLIRETLTVIRNLEATA